MSSTPSFSQLQPERFRRYYRAIEPLLEKPKNRVYTATILSFLTVSLFAWYAIRPTISTIITLRREIQDKTELNTEMEQKISSLVEAQATFQEIQDKLPLIDSSVTENPDVVPMVMEIQNLANAVSATISAIQVPQTVIVSTTGPKVENTDTTQTMRQTALSLTFSGTYDAVKNFLHELTLLRRIVDITSVTFSPQSGSAEKQQIVSTVNLTIYYKERSQTP